MLLSHSRRVYALGLLLTASAGLVMSLFLPWRHHDVPAGSGLPPDPGATIIPTTSGGSLGQLLTPVLVTAIVLVLYAVGHYLVRSGLLRILLIIAAGLAIVFDVALLLFAWVVLSLLDDTAYTSHLDSGFFVCMASLCIACAGWLLSIRS